MDINDLALPELFDHLNRHGLVQRLVDLARDEDWGPNPDVGDVTSKAAIGAMARGSARIVAREEGILCGVRVLPHVLHAFRADVDLDTLAPDGGTIRPGQPIAEITGSLRGILAAERTMLNFVGRLSGVATRTAAMVSLVRGAAPHPRLLDTRKTTPGLRVLEKYAVRCGGGHCHRVGLYDAALIKDNHLAGPPAVSDADLPGFLKRTVKRAGDEADREGLAFVEVEVDRLSQLAAILAAGGAGGASACGIHIVLLDNMNPEQLREAVRMRDEAEGTKVEGTGHWALGTGEGTRGGRAGGGTGPRLLLEASGGITPDNLAAVAATGIDRISLGTLTHGARWLDFGLDFGA